MALINFLKKFTKTEYQGFNLFSNCVLFCWFFLGMLAFKDVYTALAYAGIIVLVFSLLAHIFIRPSVEDIIL